MYLIITNKFQFISSVRACRWVALRRQRFPSRNCLPIPTRKWTVLWGKARAARCLHRDFPFLVILALLSSFFLRVTFPKNHKNRQEELLVSQHNFLAFFFQCGIFSRKKKKVEARSEKKKNKIPRSKFSENSSLPRKKIG